MARTESGRVVVDIDPKLKRRLYSALAMDNSTLKDWFIEIAGHYIDEQNNPADPTEKKSKSS